MATSNSKFKIGFGLLAIAILLAVIWFFRFSDQGTAAVWQLSRGGKLLLPLVAVSALIDSINPCAFSVLLLTVGFLLSLGQVRASILRVGLVYILGLFVVYLLIGLGIIHALHLFNTPHFMAKLAAVLLILLGLVSLINEFFPKFPIKLKIPSGAHRKMAEYMEKASLPAAFLLGALVGVCEFPCTGGPYLLVLGLLHDQATYWKGFAYLIFYNLLFVLPLVAVLFAASNPLFLEKIQTWKRENNRIMRFGGGILMVLLGVLIFFL